MTSRPLSSSRHFIRVAALFGAWVLIGCQSLDVHAADWSEQLGEASGIDRQMVIASHTSESAGTSASTAPQLAAAMVESVREAGSASQNNQFYAANSTVAVAGYLAQDALTRQPLPQLARPVEPVPIERVEEPIMRLPDPEPPRPVPPPPAPEG